MKDKNLKLEAKLKECNYNTVLRDKQFMNRHPDEIKVGDIIQLMPGSVVPADGIIIKGQDLVIDESLYKGLKSDADMTRCYKAETSKCKVQNTKIRKRHNVDIGSNRLDTKYNRRD